MKSDRCLISLVLTSCDRIYDLDRFIKSLLLQKIDFNIELIFVNQGTYNPIDKCSLPSFLHFIIVNVGHPVPLSVARNIGLRHVTGAVIGFPDDDCWYGPALLATIQRVFIELPGTHVVCTNVFDPEKGLSYGGRPLNVRKLVNFSNIFSLPISVGIFVRRETFDSVGGKFNESLGAGTFLGSGEETEVIARLLALGARILYAGDISVFHPVPTYIQSDAAKYHAYGLGYGYLSTMLIKQGRFVVVLHWFNVVVRSLIGMLLYVFVSTKRDLYWRRFAGIIHGSALAARNITFSDRL